MRNLIFGLTLRNLNFLPSPKRPFTEATKMSHTVIFDIKNVDTLAYNRPYLHISVAKPIPKKLYRESGKDTVIQKLKI